MARVLPLCSTADHPDARRRVGGSGGALKEISISIRPAGSDGLNTLAWNYLRSAREDGLAAGDDQNRRRETTQNHSTPMARS